MPPRHGKTKLSSHLFPAWFVGRHPEKSIIVATYWRNSPGTTVGRVRDLIESPLYRQVFPNVRCKLRLRLRWTGWRPTQGGVLFFLGRGRRATGRGADVILLDDPIKDRKEADSPTIREKICGTGTAGAANPADDQEGGDRDHRHPLARRRPDRPPHRSDQPLLFGRTKPSTWRVIDMPALARKDDLLGREPGRATVAGALRRRLPGQHPRRPTYAASRPSTRAARRPKRDLSSRRSTFAPTPR